MISRPLCVQCRRCGRRSAFGAISAEARRPDDEIAARLVCSRCGGRGAKVLRLSDDREAQRWLADR